MKRQYILGRPRGYILLPVVLLISLVAAAAFMLNNESVLETAVAVSSVDVARANYVADAGMQHALWQVEQTGCGPYTDISGEAFGNHSYSATITPNNAGGTITTYTVPVSDDAWVREDLPTNNYGSDAQLGVYQKWFSSEGRRALYRFDLATSGIPSGAMVVSAVAKIFVVTPDPSSSVGVHQVTADWTEAAANWDNVTADSSSIASIASNPPAGQYVDVNITSLVQGWLSGSIANQGIMLKPSLFSNDNLSEYSSKEYGTASQRPELVIKVADGSLSNRADISVTGTLASGISKNLSRKDIPLYQASPLSITLQPGSEGKDAEIWDKQPNNNYGDAAETWVSSASNDKTRSLLHFNMNAIPAGAKIQSATLSLLRQSGSGADQPVSAHRIMNPWSENSVTWNSRESGTSWDIAGSDFDNMAVVTTPVGPVNQRYEWNITPLVQGWVDGSFQNHGVVLAAAIDGMPGERFYTSDDSDPTRHPRLTITYTCQCGVVCVSLQGSGNVLLVVGDDATLASGDVKKQALFESWGYNINLIDDDSDQLTFDTALANNDVAYISETVWGPTLAAKLADTDKGVVNEEEDQNSRLGLSSSGSNMAGDSMEIIDNSHYITALFPNSVLPIFSAPMEGLLVTGTPASGLQTLGNFSGTASLALVDVGGALGGAKSGENAAGRRVAIPVGSNDKFNWDYLNNNGRLIVQRAIQWGIDVGISVPKPKKIYWTDDVAEIIQRSDEDGSNVETVISGQFKVRGLDIDTVNGKIYWTSDDYIIRADLDGSNIEKVYSTATKLNFDVKLDVAAGKMYWTYDNLDNEVMRANLDGSSVQTLNTSTNRPMYFSLDTANGFIYVTEYGNNSISRMNLDGSAVTTIVAGSGGGNMGSAIDTVNGKIYWTGGSTNDWIKRANLDGSNEETIISGQNSPQDISYDADNDRIYWTDAVDFVIRRANADGSNVETIVSAVNRPRGIVSVDANLVPPTGGATGPIAHWKLDDSGSTAVDSEGGHDGTLTNGPDWVTGQLDGALDFDGNNDFVSVPHADMLSLSDAMTFTAWVNSSSFGSSYQTIIAKDGGGSGSNYYFGTWQSELVFGFFSGGTFREIFTSGLNLQTGTWYLLAATFDNATDTVRLYVDGVQVRNGTLAFNPTVVSDDLTIGKSPDGEYWRGKLDDVRLYNSVLPASEIVDLHAAGSGGGGGGGGGSEPGNCDGTYRDEFETVSYSNNDGSLSWTTDWIEINESDGANSGDEKIMSDTGHSSLRLTDNDGGGEGVEREVDLSGAATASISLLYRRNKLDDINDRVTMWISTNGSVGPWSELIFFAGGGTDSDYVPFNLDISAFISTNTRIRFLTSPTMGGKDEVYFDDIQIECSP